MEVVASAGLGSRSRLALSRPVVASLFLIPLALCLTAQTSIAGVQYWAQDWIVFLLFLVALLGLTFRVPHLAVRNLRLRWWQVVAGSLVLALLLWLGTYVLMFNYPLTRDEHMVVFDMAVFAKGHLLEPLAPQWRSFAKALVPAFLMPVPDHAAMISTYLPGNAMLRMAFSQVVDPALMSPLLVAISILALFDIASRLFAGDRRALLVTMVLFVGSAQLLVNGMTVFAMTGHTALNLVWLALFLRDRPWSHAAAMAITAIALGLHQIVFHPLVAGPFLLWRLSQRRYLLFTLYTAVFAATGLFWIVYPTIAVRSMGIAAAGGAGDSGYFWRDRVLPLLLRHDEFGELWMTLNLVRFIVWNNLALLPLIFAAWPLVRRNTGIAAPLAAGIVLTILICWIMLPNQGHGWGYRYLAAVLGSCALLGGLGYQRWAEVDRRTADGVFITFTAMTALVLLFLLVRTHQFVAPYAELDRLSATATSDMVLVDTEEPSAAIDQVRNWPDLSNRPIRLSSRDLEAPGLRELCRRGTISLITRADMRRVGFSRRREEDSPQFHRKVALALEGQPCLVRLSAP
jgi:hypothetical protein